jgi:hypothetical protein
MSNTRTIARRFAVPATLLSFAIAAVFTARVAAAYSKPVSETTNTSKSTSTLREPSNRWLDGLKAKQRQFFDAPTPNGGIALVHVMNYYDTYNKAFGVKDNDIDAVLTFYGATTFYGVNDAMWAKYALGEFTDAIDPVTGKPARKNPWRAAPVVLGLTLPQASIEALHARGATLILCNNALTIFSSLLAAKRGLDPKAVYDDLNANILPGVDLVPGMVVAVEQAARAGLSYHRQ